MGRVCVSAVAESTHRGVAAARTTGERSGGIRWKRRRVDGSAAASKIHKREANCHKIIFIRTQL